MTFISTFPQSDDKPVSAKDETPKTFFERISQFSRAFWHYTEETSETSTKSFEGLL